MWCMNTINDPRIIGAASLTNIFTWIDSAYDVHPDMRSHTGGVVLMSLGALRSKSGVQKLNTKRYTEAEIVGVSEYLPYNIWMINFMNVQGYRIKDNIIYQNNQSGIHMETNGRYSCTSNSKHIDIQHFFVTDRVKKKEFSIQYFPTEIMLAGFFTKLLQGALFRKLR